MPRYERKFTAAERSIIKFCKAEPRTKGQIVDEHHRHNPAYVLAVITRLGREGWIIQAYAPSYTESTPARWSTANQHVVSSYSWNWITSDDGQSFIVGDRPSDRITLQSRNENVLFIELVRVRGLVGGFEQGDDGLVGAASHLLDDLRSVHVAAHRIGAALVFTSFIFA